MDEQQDKATMTWSEQLRQIADHLEGQKVDILQVHNAIGNIYVAMTTQVFSMMAADLTKLSNPHRIVQGTN